MNRHLSNEGQEHKTGHANRMSPHLTVLALSCCYNKMTQNA
jgi:hypothetical protein